MACPYHHIVTQYTDLRIAAYYTFGYHTPGNITNTRDAEDFANFNHTNDLFALFGCKHARQCRLNIFYGIVNNIVVTNLDAILLGLTTGSLFCTNVKPDDDCVRSNCEVDVAFRNTTHSRVDNVDLNLFVSQ